MDRILKVKEHTVCHGDATLEKSYKLLLGDSKVDLILADPPYCLLTRRNKKTGQKRDPKKEKINHSAVTRFEKVKDFSAFTQKWMQHSVNYLKDDGIAIIWNNFLGIDPIKKIAGDLGLHFWGEFKWAKLTKEGSGNEQLARVYEVALIFAKYKKPTLDNSQREYCLSHVGPYDDNKEAQKWGGHPNHKPFDLQEVLLRAYSTIGDKVLDPFSGSGSTLGACVVLQRQALVMEISQVWYEMSCERIKSQLL